MKRIFARMGFRWLDAYVESRVSDVSLLQIWADFRVQIRVVLDILLDKVRDNKGQFEQYLAKTGTQEALLRMGTRILLVLVERKVKDGKEREVLKALLAKSTEAIRDTAIYSKPAPKV